MNRPPRFLGSTARAGMMATFGALPLFLLGAQSVAISHDLGLGPADLGLATGTFFAAGAAATLLMARVVDRLPLRATAIAAGTFAGSAGLGVAVGGRSLFTLLAFLATAGVGNAALQLTANLAVARSVAKERQGLAYGIKQSANPLAALLAGAMGAAALHVGGWRVTYIVSGLMSLVVALSALRVARSVRGASAAPAEPDRPPRSALVVSGVATALASSSAVSVAAFLPAWAFDSGMSPAGAGLLLASAGAASLVARLSVGWMADHRPDGHLTTVRWLLLIGAVGFVGLAYPHLVTIVLGGFVALAFGWGWPGLLIYAVVRLGRDVPGEASSAIQTGAFVGGAIGPPAFGLVVEGAQFSVAWMCAGVVALIAAALVTWARNLFARDLAARVPVV